MRKYIRSMRYLRWFISLSLPVLLIMLAVRMFTLPWYPTWQYSRPSFPADPLGMDGEERLRLALACIGFLNKPHNTEILASLKFDDGQEAFLTRELDHMDDVKVVYDRMTVVAIFIFLFDTLFCILMQRKGKILEVNRAFFHGSIIILMALILLGVWMLTGFDTFFTVFHGLFFAEGTWLFSYNDTLIRLFPLRFWQDAGMGIAILIAFIASVITAVTVFVSRQMILKS